MTPLAMELIEDLYSKIYIRPIGSIDGLRDKEQRSSRNG